jgi:hypothetical protein
MAIRATTHRTHCALAACFGVPVVVLGASYLWLALDHGTPALWDVIVHENGRRTLGQTVLYFGHFLREVPVDVAYALFLIGASGELAGGVSNRVAGRARMLTWLGLGGAAALAAAALIGTAANAGWGSALRDLFQFRTRDELIAYGSHWRFHWLSTLWFGVIAGLAPALARSFSLQASLGRNRVWTRAAWGYFVALTIVFGLSSDVFVDARYVGHQAREILTHGPVTALLGIGVILAVRRAMGNPSMVESAADAREIWLRLAVAVTIPAYLAVVALTGDVMAAGQSDQGLAAMVGAHYFEHILDYLLVGLLVLGALGLQTDRRSRRLPPRS